MKSIKILILIASALSASGVRGQTVEWSRQLSRPFDDGSSGVSADSLGNVYISGYTDSNLGGRNLGGLDFILAKYDAAGTQRWIRQFGTNLNDYSAGVSTDGFGNAFFTGTVWNQANGNYDAFVAKYSSDGVVQWTRQLDLGGGDASYDVSADPLGNVYITGLTNSNPGRVTDGFLSKYDANGTHLWTREFGSTDYDISSSVSADGLGNVFITGGAYGPFGYPDEGEGGAFLSKYDADGILQWSRRFNNGGGSVSADGTGNVFVDGSLSGSGAGNHNASVSKYDGSGTLLWTRELGTPADDTTWNIAADQRGNVFMTGYTKGDLATTNFGGEDSFVAKYNSNGMLQWVRQFGTAGSDIGRGVSADGMGGVYFTGDTRFGPTGPPLGTDIFLMKIADIPEPASGLLLVAIVGWVMIGRLRQYYIRTPEKALLGKSAVEGNGLDGFPPLRRVRLV